MKNSLSYKKLLGYGKQLSGFASILLVLLFAVSCSNMLVSDGGSLIIALPGVRAATASSFTIKLTGANGFAQNKTISGGNTVQFDDLAPGAYNIVVEGINTNNKVVVGGSKSVVVKPGENASVMIALEALIGELTVNLLGTTATKYTIELKDSKGITQKKEFSAAEDIEFDELPLGSCSISVKGTDNTDDTIVCFGTSNATIKAGEQVTAEVSLAGVVNNFDELKTAISNGGIIYVGSDISIDATITETPSTPVTIQAAYKDVTLSGTGSTPMFQPTAGEWTFGGGEHTITLSGGSSNKSIFTISGSATPKVTLTTNGIINSSTTSQSAVIISEESAANNSIFCLDGGSITGRAAHSVEVYANGQFIMKRGSIIANAQNVVYLYGGTFSMTGGEINNSSTTSTYRSVRVANGSFTFEGGYITKDIVVDKSDLFTISGSATVDTIKLNTYNIYFTVGGKLEGNSTVATITPGRYQDGEQILKAGSGVDLAAEVGKFKVTPKSDGTQWTINTDGTLQQVQ